MRSLPLPPRLHVLLARDAPYGLIVLRRRHKEKLQSCTIGWNLTDDTFTVGQWLKGQIYEHRCDLSPDGKHFLYFVANYHGSFRQDGSQPYRIWTAVSRAPYLKALIFSGQGTTHGGGGFFEDATHFWLNGYEEAEKGLADKLDLITQPPSNYPWGFVPPELYTRRLVRDGWHPQNQVFQTQILEAQVSPLWEKKQSGWTLRQVLQYQTSQLQGRGYLYQLYQAHNSLSDAAFGNESWEWADFRGNRLLWAQGGKIFATQVQDAGHGDIIELADFNDCKFQPIKAPY